MKIKLGIDAKWYFTGPPSGHVVVRNLVDNILEHPLNFEIFLILNSRDRKRARLTFAGSVNLIFIPHIPNMFANMFLLPVAAGRHKLDAVLYQNFSSLWPAKLFKVAYIHDVLFLDMPQYYNATERFYFNRMTSLARAADMLVTISEEEKKRLTAHHVGAPDNVKVVYHGVDENFRPLAAYTKAAIQTIEFKYHLPAKYILYVGRVNIRKNISSLIRAMSLMKTRIQLLIVGEKGNAGDSLNQLIETLQLNHQVVFTGHVPEKDIYLLYARAAVFCFPSYAEGFGLPPLEAMKSGVPVVVSARTAMPEVCGEAAVYINPDKPAEIALKMDELLCDGKYYAQKANAGIGHAKQFTWQKAANQILTSITYGYANRKHYSQIKG